ncbi:uncharacterized protein Eint_091560 [Encephalitozoon intestinalis ATCC 50506]|uniref:Uncharacterized protein n=1 Tax=Encephalitozoon intestinalis (strain ATCC 50506) TaxID=876142 RepID=E0S928_ENCIT|nr:uncharacterized protein Eint_091560 [Encephalitozoon intestinalis ATCC 50506]ADM12284.1 hypothetical protein Eint_091560 [Encephalitozoon intestinalis ATCC 50506]UTX46093.1 DUF1686 domain-containing protein [Encephalitozoon intestinalis]
MDFNQLKRLTEYAKIIEGIGDKEAVKHLESAIESFLKEVESLLDKVTNLGGNLEKAAEGADSEGICQNACQKLTNLSGLLKKAKESCCGKGPHKCTTLFKSIDDVLKEVTEEGLDNTLGGLKDFLGIFKGDETLGEDIREEVKATTTTIEKFLESKFDDKLTEETLSCFKKCFSGTVCEEQCASDFSEGLQGKVDQLKILVDECPKEEVKGQLTELFEQVCALSNNIQEMAAAPENVFKHSCGQLANFSQVSEEFRSELRKVKGTLKDISEKLIDLEKKSEEIRKLTRKGFFERLQDFYQRLKENILSINTGSLYGNLCLAFLGILVIQIIIWSFGREDEETDFQKAWNTTVYFIAVVVSIIYLQWLANKGYKSSSGIGDTLKKEWPTILSTIPMMIGILNFGPIKSSIYALTMAATAVVMLYAQNLVRTNNMSKKGMLLVGVGNLIIILAYFTGPESSFMPTISGPNYRAYTALIIFVILLLIISYLERNLPKEEVLKEGTPGTKGLAYWISYALFALTLITVTWVSYMAGSDYHQLYGSNNSTKPLNDDFFNS